MRHVKSLFLRLGFFGILGLAACGQSAETRSVCQLSSRWNQTSADVATVLKDLGSIPAGRIRDTMLEVVSNLQSFSEIAPREIRNDVELLLNTYGALSDALEAIEWDGSVASRDAAVTSTGVRLASDEIQSAQTNFAKFISDNCSLEIENAVNQFPNVGSTLPDPVIIGDDETNLDAGADNEESVARAFGYVVVERFGVAITDDQASCVGDALLGATSADSSTVDLTYWEMLQEIFDTCEVKIDVKTALENE
ncbi:MAG: hypothetical protein ACKORD_06610 [Acidimicrobiaceae bacterium]